MKNKDFCHLHLHTEYSALDGFGSPSKYIELAKSVGFEYLAMTDHGNIDGAIKFLNECIDNNLKPVIGCEMYIDEDRFKKDKNSHRKHINLWVKNEKGWHNLL